ncbi:MAG: DNA photolyase family protein [Gammaproteobacteria bacterium]|nr:DNA photolyase family protein [Gammaproteobacteria bacterium]
MSETTLVWFRQDLRLKDNPALNAARESDNPMVLVYILDETIDPDEQIGGAAKWWLHRSLDALAQSIEKTGNRLVLRRGDPLEILEEIAEKADITEVHWNRVYEPQAIARDKEIKAALCDRDIDVSSHNGSLLFEPWTVKNQAGKPYKVYSQYWRRGCLQNKPQWPELNGKPRKLAASKKKIASDKLKDWALLPSDPDWAEEFDVWQPGEKGAAMRLRQFIDKGLDGYKELRNRPDMEKVSRLSPHLHWGEIAPWHVWAAVESADAADRSISRKDVEHFLSEIGWREFAYHLLYHFPTLPVKNWREQFDGFPWKKSKKKLKAWQKGQTGYPIVDAGMRELWATGWMHNRVRMIVASFLIKDLMIHWREGERWFWDTLVDADLANNSSSWQWVAGSGADAAPYFRIFNPVTQGEKFDPDGEYVRRWVPEIAELDEKVLHHPWDADADELKDAGVKLGKTYPKPIVDHAEAREAALAAYQQIKK